MLLRLPRLSMTTMSPGPKRWHQSRPNPSPEQRLIDRSAGQERRIDGIRTQVAMTIIVRQRHRGSRPTIRRPPRPKPLGGVMFIPGPCVIDEHQAVDIELFLMRASDGTARHKPGCHRPPARLYLSVMPSAGSNRQSPVWAPRARSLHERRGDLAFSEQERVRTMDER